MLAVQPRLCDLVRALDPNALRYDPDRMLKAPGG